MMCIVGSTTFKMMSRKWLYLYWKSWNIIVKKTCLEYFGQNFVLFVEMYGMTFKSHSELCFCHLENPEKVDMSFSIW